MQCSCLNLKGAIGKALRLSCNNRLKKVDYGFMAAPFKNRSETDGFWRCEFWGKVTRSAILTNHWLNDPELATMIRKAVADILHAQTEDGCISTYPTDCQAKNWDIWGRKYVLLTLLRYYKLVEKDDAVLDACRRLVNHMMTQVGPQALDIRTCGWHGGLAPASILVAIVELYELTGENKYLDYAKWIADTGCSLDGDIATAALEGVVPAAIGNGKAYELTSCFEGLAELYKYVPDPRYRDACLAYFNAVRKREIFITGVGGLKDRVGEYWYEGAFRQTSPAAGQRGETCITATWLHYCKKMAELMPDSMTPIAEAERTIYNGMLGAMKPDGSDWIHVNPSPLTGGGFKQSAKDQIMSCAKTPFDNHDCCRAQGPEGLAFAPCFMLDVDAADAIRLNIPEDMCATFDNGATLDVSGNYPYGDTVRIRFTAPDKTPLKLRIPSFCQSLAKDGRKLPFIPENYATFCGSCYITMTLDLSLKELAAPGDASYVAVKRGPIVLAEDNKGDVPTANVHETWNGRHLVDYASAGGDFSPDNTLTVWFRR